MAKIIGFIQVKGGAGRSTLATNLAGMIADKRKVALIDCDMPQGTSASWASIRSAESKAGNLTIATASNHLEMVEQVARLNDDHDAIVIDSPPRIAEMTRAALILSDLCLIPLGASAAEIWATGDLLQTIEQAKAHKPGVDARIVWNRYRRATRSAHELSDAVKHELDVKEMKTRIGYRVAYSEALARGMTVMEWPDKSARKEMQDLGREVSKLIGLKF